VLNRLDCWVALNGQGHEFAEVRRVMLPAGKDDSMLFKRKSRWAKFIAGAAVLKAIPKKPVGIAALLGGGYMVYRALSRNTHTYEHGEAHIAA
jgi:hypothetical protein